MSDPTLDAILDPDRAPAGTFLVRTKRRDGTPVLIAVPNEHFDRVEALCRGEFKDTSIAIAGRTRWRE